MTWITHGALTHRLGDGCPLVTLGLTERCPGNGPLHGDEHAGDEHAPDMRLPHSVACSPETAREHLRNAQQIVQGMAPPLLDGCGCAFCAISRRITLALAALDADNP